MVLFSQDALASECSMQPSPSRSQACLCWDFQKKEAGHSPTCEWGIPPKQKKHGCYTAKRANFCNIHEHLNLLWFSSICDHRATLPGAPTDTEQEATTAQDSARLWARTPQLLFTIVREDSQRKSDVPCRPEAKFPQLVLTDRSFIFCKVKNKQINRMAPTMSCGFSEEHIKWRYREELCNSKVPYNTFDYQIKIETKIGSKITK